MENRFVIALLVLVSAFFVFAILSSAMFDAYAKWLDKRAEWAKEQARIDKQRGQSDGLA